MDETPGPLALFRKIPETIRWWTYAVAATAFAVEGVLDVADVGLIPSKVESVALSVLGLFGFTMASANTRS